MSWNEFLQDSTGIFQKFKDLPIVSATTSKLLETSQKTVSELDQRIPKLDNILGPLTDLATDCEEADVSGYVGEMKSRFTTTSQDAVDGLVSALQSLGDEAITMTSSNGKAFIMRLDDAETTITDDVLGEITTLYTSCPVDKIVSDASDVIIGKTSDGKIWINNKIKSIDYSFTHIIPEHPGIYGQLEAYAQFRGLPHCDTIIEYVRALSGRTNATTILPDNFQGSVIEYINSIAPVVDSAEGLYMSFSYLIREQLDNSVILSTIREALSGLHSNNFDPNTFLSGIKDTYGNVSGSVVNIANTICGAFKTGGFTAAIKTAISTVTATSDSLTVNNGTIGFTDNSQFKPQSLLAGIISGAVNVLGTIIGAIASVFSAGVGILLMAVGTLTSKIIDLVSAKADSDTYASYSDTAMLDGLPIGFTQVSINNEKMWKRCRSCGPQVVDTDAGYLLFTAIDDSPSFGVRVEMHAKLVISTSMLNDAGSQSIYNGWAWVPMKDLSESTSGNTGYGIDLSVWTLSKLEQCFSNEQPFEDPTNRLSAADTDKYLRKCLLCSLNYLALAALIMLYGHLSGYVLFSRRAMEHDYGFSDAVDYLFHPFSFMDLDDEASMDWDSILRFEQAGATLSPSPLHLFYANGRGARLFLIQKSLLIYDTTIDAWCYDSTVNPILEYTFDPFNKYSEIYGSIASFVTSESQSSVTFGAFSPCEVYNMTHFNGFSISCPKYNRIEYFFALAVVTVATVAIATAAAIGSMKIKKAIRMKQAKNQANAGAAWEAYQADPTAENYKDYTSAVRKNNFFAGLTNGTKLSKVSYWDEGPGSGDGIFSGIFNKEEETEMSLQDGVGTLLHAITGQDS